MAVLLLATFMAVLTSTIVTVAVPAIRTELDASPEATVWVLGAYALAYGAVLISAGRFGDVHGRRRVFLAGLGVFTGAAAAAALSPSASVLIAATAAQGVGAGCCVPQVLGTVATVVPPAARERAFGLYGVATGFGAAAGPIAGGALLAVDPLGLGWRAVFWLVAVIAAVALVLGVVVVPDSRGSGSDSDPIGAVLLIGALVLVLAPLTAVPQTGITIGTASGAAAGVVVLGVFAGWQHHRRARGATALLDPALLRVRSFTNAGIIGLAYFAVFQGLLLTTSIYLQAGRGQTPLVAGLALAPFALAAVAASMASDIATRRLGPRAVVVGAGLVALGLALVLVLVEFAAAPAALAAALIVSGLGHGMIVPPNVHLGLRDVPAALAGGAGGAINTAQRIGQTVGVSVLGGWFLHDATRDGYTHAFAVALIVQILGALAVAACGLRLARHRPVAPTR